MRLRGISGALLLLALACKGPHQASANKVEPDSYSTLGVAADFFPMPGSDSASEMKALAVHVLKKGRDPQAEIHLPDWMVGTWSIRGSSRYRKVLIAQHGMVFEARDVAFPVLSARISPSGRLMAIHTGLVGGGDSDSLYAGFLDVPERRDLQENRTSVERWTFTERSVFYGFGLNLEAREIWSFTRMAP